MFFLLMVNGSFCLRMITRDSTTLTACASTVARARAGYVHMENRYEKQVSYDIHGTGNGHKNQGQPGISIPLKILADHVVGDDKEDAASADADIISRQIHRLRRRLHKNGKRTRKRSGAVPRG